MLWTAHVHHFFWARSGQLGHTVLAVHIHVTRLQVTCVRRKKTSRVHASEAGVQSCAALPACPCCEPTVNPLEFGYTKTADHGWRSPWRLHTCVAISLCEGGMRALRPVCPICLQRPNSATLPRAFRKHKPFSIQSYPCPRHPPCPTR
jgi:hypothetical protein